MASARLQLVRSAPAIEQGEAAVAERSPRIKGTWSAEHLSALARALEADLVPRLERVRRASVVAGSPQRRKRLPRSHAGDAEILADIVLGDAMSGAMAHMEDLRVSGVAVESLIVDVLEPAAVRLGNRWLDDRCDLAALALSLTRLQQILRAYSGPLFREIGQPVHERRVLVALAPGEEEGFGSALTAELFYCAGWCVEREFASSAAGLAATAKRHRLDVMHLSLSGAIASTERVGPLAQVIARVRAASCNPDLRVLVAGRVFGTERGLALRIGADGGCAGARDAVVRAARLIGGTAMPSPAEVRGVAVQPRRLR